MKKTILALVVVGIAALGTGVLLSVRLPRTNLSSERMMNKGVSVPPSDEFEIREPDNRDITTNGARYVVYSPETLFEAQNRGRTVLFFAALSWCPTCREADADIKNNLDKIPADVTIVRMDYDNDQENKTKYAVVSQDTFVQIDSDGNTVTAWNSGGKGIDALLDNIQ